MLNLKTWKGKSLSYIWDVKIKGTFNRQILSKIYKYFSKSTVKVSEKRWAKAQKGELDFHKENDYRLSLKFAEDTRLLFESFGFKSNDFKNKTILDLGSGSKLRTNFFINANIIAIDPLLNEYKNLPHYDIHTCHKSYSLGIEKWIPELESTIDYAISINVLDHCFDFEKCLENTFRYLKLGSKAFVSFDCHFYTDNLHPLILTEEVCTPILKKTGFTIEKFSEGHSGEYKARMNNNSYGHGVSCLNYWLKKPLYSEAKT